MEAVEAALVEIDDLIPLKIEILQRVSKALKSSCVNVSEFVAAQIQNLRGVEEFRRRWRRRKRRKRRRSKMRSTELFTIDKDRSSLWRENRKRKERKK